MVASHTAGLPYPPLGTGLSGLDLHRGEAVTRALAAAHPLWKPGTAMAYHPVTYGTLLDEIVRRATGASIGSHVRTLIAEPLGVDMWIGAPEAVIPRVVPGQWEESSPMEPAEVDPEPGSYAALRQQFLRENPPMDPDFSDPDDVRAHYMAERPAVGAITNARALATMYAALLGPDWRGAAHHRRNSHGRIPPANRRSRDADRERDRRTGHSLRRRLPARLAEHARIRAQLLRPHWRRRSSRHRRPRLPGRLWLHLQSTARHRRSGRPAMGKADCCHEDVYRTLVTSRRSWTYRCRGALSPRSRLWRRRQARVR